MYSPIVKEYVGNLAVITTIIQFLSGVPVCKKYVANKTTAETSPLPFICGVVASCVWFLYGLLKHENKMILVNIVGVTLMASYTVVFYFYTFKKSTLLKQVFVMVVFLTFLFGYVFFEEDNEMLMNRLGLMGCSLTLLAIAAPLSKLLHVLKVKSTECLPFPMILMSFIVSMLWFMYGIIIEDSYLKLPNFIGAVLAVFQLSLFVIYPSKPQSPILGKSILA